MAKSIREQLFGNSKDFEEIQIVLDGVNRATDAVIQATKFIKNGSVEGISKDTEDKNK